MIVVDASALLAFMFREPGWERVRDVLGTSLMTTVNLSEVLARFARDGHDTGAVRRRLSASPIGWVDFSVDLARRAADLAPVTARLGLSLGDRACLALGVERGLPVMTTDRTWRRLALPVAVDCIRG